MKYKLVNFAVIAVVHRCSLTLFNEMD